MCIGIPMQVIRAGEFEALCLQGEELKIIDVRLVGAVKEGDWVLTFLDAAREIITAEAAQKITDALQALTLVLNGSGDVDHLFADLIDRQPELPDFLKIQPAKDAP